MNMRSFFDCSKNVISYKEIKEETGYIRFPLFSHIFPANPVFMQYTLL